MKTLVRSLQDYPPAMLRAIAETTGVALTSNVARRMIEELADFLCHPGRLNALLAACSPAAREALAVLLREEGRSLRLAFERQHGVIRAMGPGRLERERPHLAPINPSEELWYRGLIFSAFAETPSGMAEFLYIPGDIASVLPPPEPALAGLRLPASPTPDAVQPANDFLLHDICTLLCLVQAGEVHLVDSDDPISWQRTSLYELSRTLLQPTSDLDESPRDGPGSPVALALSLADDLGWLHPRGRRRLALHAASVRTWLEAPRDQQRRIVREAWQASQSWNDLCRTPSLACEDTGNWHNDPVATRARLVPLLTQLEPDAWTTLDALVAAVKTTAPDFQRPDGDYDTWYIRERDSQTYLRGFDCWDAVEGELLRFLITGPLHWLGAVNLGLAAQPTAATPGSAVATASAPVLTAAPTPSVSSSFNARLAEAPSGTQMLSLSTSGHAWLTAQPPPAESTAGHLTVLADYAVLVPADAPLLDRFRVSRFTAWEPPTRSQPDAAPTYCYRITQSGLRRAAEQGIDALRILTFLQERCTEPLPAPVVSGLQRWHNQSTSAPT